MLSTTRIKFPFQILPVAISILILALAIIMIYSSGVLPGFSAVQPSAQNSNTLSAQEVSTYRWQALADYYTTQQVQVPVTGSHLTILSPAEASTYRWEAMAKFHAMQESAALSWPPRPDFSHLNQ